MVYSLTAGVTSGFHTGPALRALPSLIGWPRGVPREEKRGSADGRANERVCA
jgi:hypothetical protein